MDHNVEIDNNLFYCILYKSNVRLVPTMKPHILPTLALVATILVTTLSTVFAQKTSEGVSNTFTLDTRTKLYMSSTGHTPSDTYVAEVMIPDTPTLPQIKKLEMPPVSPQSHDSSAGSLRDLIDTDKGLQVITGTFAPVVATYGVSSWQNGLAVTNWGLVANGTSGGLATDGNGALFLPGMQIKGSQRGIYFVKYIEGRLIAPDIEPFDLAYSNGKVYAVLHNYVTVNTNMIVMLDPKKDPAERKYIPVKSGDYRAITVAGDGTIFVATWNGIIFRLTSEGKVLGETTVKVQNPTDPDAPWINVHLSDIDISPDGETIAFGTADGYIGLVSPDFSMTRTYGIGSSGSVTFVAWPKKK